MLTYICDQMREQEQNHGFTDIALRPLHLVSLVVRGWKMARLEEIYLHK